MNSPALARIPHGGIEMEGFLDLPPHAAGVVIFAHGSGSSRFSPRNSYVAKVLRASGVGTLLVDLLTPEEDSDYEKRFDIGLLTGRLVATTRWMKEQPVTRFLPVGLFGASTGAAAALETAAILLEEIKAVVSRGGRPDLARATSLTRVAAPTLLIVGGDDDQVIELNKQAYDQLRCKKELTIVPGATHLFEEPGTLEKVASLASAWFTRYLSPPA